MTSVNFLKPNKDNLNLFLVVGALFFSLGIIDFCLNNFYDTNITGFLPGFISFFTPLIFGMIGLHLIRIEFSGIKILDELNKNINTNNFNAALSLSSASNSFNELESMICVFIIISFWSVFRI